jgi:uncharacterized GH25 family protein
MFARWHSRGVQRVAAALLALASAPLFAHDLWIEPSTFTPRDGELVSLRLRVGENLQGEPLPYLAARVRRFAVQDSAAARPVVTRHGGEPAGAVRVAAPGLAVIDYQSHPSRIELDAAKFDAYLREEGLDAAIAARSALPTRGDMVREMFARCAKSLLWSGTPQEVRGDTALGCPLELVAERSPYPLSTERMLSFRLTYRGAPLVGALVVALNGLDPSTRQSARSDAAGRVEFRVRPGGLWLVKAVHMVSAPLDSEADWLSWWASLTFGSATPSH